MCASCSTWLPRHSLTTTIHSLSTIVTTTTTAPAAPATTAKSAEDFLDVAAKAAEETGKKLYETFKKAAESIDVEKELLVAVCTHAPEELLTLLPD